jgi:hypothetical protein
VDKLRELDSKLDFLCDNPPHYYLRSRNHLKILRVKSIRNNDTLDITITNPVGFRSLRGIIANGLHTILYWSPLELRKQYPLTNA